MISLRVCLPSKFNLTSPMVGIFLETTAAYCKQMSITTDLMDFPQKSNRSFFIRERGKGVICYETLNGVVIHLIKAFSMFSKLQGCKASISLGCEQFATISRLI